MGIFSAIGGAISSTFSAIGGALGSVGSALFSGLSTLGSLFPPVSALIGGIGLVLNLFRGNEVPDMEDLGFQIREAREQGIIRENFDNYEDYFDKVLEMPSDKKNATEEDKLGARILGTTETMLGINEKAGMEIGIGVYEFLNNSIIKSENISIEILKSINNILSKNSITNEKLEDYKEKKSFGTDKKEVENALSEISEVVNIPVGDILKEN